MRDNRQGLPYAGHPIELEDGRRVPLDTFLAQARRLRPAELRSLWSGVPAYGARIARSLVGLSAHRRRSGAELRTATDAGPVDAGRTGAKAVAYPGESGEAAEAVAASAKEAKRTKIAA